MWRRLTVVVAAASITLAACSGGRGLRASGAGTATPTAPVADQASEVSRPPGVPGDATLLTGALDLGGAGSSSGAPQETLDIMYAVRCRDGLVTIATTRETLYAQRPCSRVPADEAFRTYYSNPVLIRISGGDPQQLSINTDTIGSLGFSADRVWLLRR